MVTFRNSQFLFFYTTRTETGMKGDHLFIFVQEQYRRPKGVILDRSGAKGKVYDLVPVRIKDEISLTSADPIGPKKLKPGALGSDFMVSGFLGG